MLIGSPRINSLPPMKVWHPTVVIHSGSGSGESPLPYVGHIIPRGGCPTTTALQHTASPTSIGLDKLPHLMRVGALVGPHRATLSRAPRLHGAVVPADACLHRSSRLSRSRLFVPAIGSAVDSCVVPTLQSHAVKVVFGCCVARMLLVSSAGLKACRPHCGHVIHMFIATYAVLRAR